MVLLYPLLTAALYYLGSRAKVTQWLWSRYPAGFASFMDCAACTGFWYGMGVEIALREFVAYVEFSPIVVGLCALVWTPMIAALMQHSLFTLGSAVDADVSPSGEGTDHGNG